MNDLRKRNSVAFHGSAVVGKVSSRFVYLVHAPHPTLILMSPPVDFSFCLNLYLGTPVSVTLQERHPGDSKNYNECIRHETIRVAVCDMMEGKCPCPEPLR